MLFIADAQFEIITEKNIQGSPALVIEVVSNSRIDRVRKRDIYARFGIAEYWVVDPLADRVEIHRLEGAQYGKPEISEVGDEITFGGLPNLKIPLASLVAR